MCFAHDKRSYSLLETKKLSYYITMRFVNLTTHIFLSAIVLVLVTSKRNRDRSTACKPRLTMVPTSGDGRYLYPQVVWLKRCSGIDDIRDRHRFQCVASETIEVEQKVTSDLDEDYVVVLEEHISCTIEECGGNGCGPRADCFTDNNIPKGYIDKKILVVSSVAQLAITLLVVFFVKIYCKNKKELLVRARTLSMRTRPSTSVDPESNPVVPPD